MFCESIIGTNDPFALMAGGSIEQLLNRVLESELPFELLDSVRGFWNGKNNDFRLVLLYQDNCLWTSRGYTD
jgi:hypothetical protein